MYFLHQLVRHALTVMAGLCALLTPVITLTLVLSGTNVDLIGQPFMSTSKPHTTRSHSPGEALTTVGLALGNNPGAHKGLRTQKPTAETLVHLVSAVTYCGSACDGTGDGTDGGIAVVTATSSNTPNTGGDGNSGSTDGNTSFTDHSDSRGNTGGNSGGCDHGRHFPCRPSGGTRNGDDDGGCHDGRHPTCPPGGTRNGNHSGGSPCDDSFCPDRRHHGGGPRGDGPPRRQPDPLPLVVAVQPPVVQRPVVQPPVVQATVVQAPVVQPPVEQPPVEPVAVPTAPPPAVPEVEAPVSSLGFFKVTPGLWPVIVALILLGVGLLVALLVLHAVRNRHGQKWMRARIQVVAGADPSVGVEVMESRTDRSPSTCVVRLEPHAGSGTHIFEEVHP
jgi:hypothetical protein